MTSTARSRGIGRAIEVTTSNEALLAGAVLVVQILAIFGYLASTGVQVLSVAALLYPVAWITLSTYLVAWLWLRGPRVRQSRIAIVVGGGYFLVLAVVAGLVWPAPELLGYEHHATAGGTLLWAAPGWGPAYLYGTSFLQVAIVPFKVIGYAALSYGIAAAVAASSRGALAGLFGVFSCVGCVLPLIALVSGVFGSAGTVATSMGASYRLGTLVFAGTVLILLVAIPTQEAGATRSR